MNERTLRQTIGRMRHERGKDAAVTWALSRGYAVRWGRDGLTIRPLV